MSNSDGFHTHSFLPCNLTLMKCIDIPFLLSCLVTATIHLPILTFIELAALTPHQPTQAVYILYLL